MLQHATSLPLCSVLSGAAAPSSAAGPSPKHPVPLSVSVTPSSVCTAVASPSVVGSVTAGAAVSVPAAVHASNVLRTCSALDAMSTGMGGRASDARFALDALEAALGEVLAEHSAPSGIV